MASGNFSVADWPRPFLPQAPSQSPQIPSGGPDLLRQVVESGFENVIVLTLTPRRRGRRAAAIHVMPQKLRPRMVADGAACRPPAEIGLRDVQYCPAIDCRPSRWLVSLSEY